MALPLAPINSGAEATAADTEHSESPIASDLGDGSPSEQELAKATEAETNVEDSDRGDEITQVEERLSKEEDSDRGNEITEADKRLSKAEHDTGPGEASLCEPKELPLATIATDQAEQ